MNIELSKEEINSMIGSLENSLDHLVNLTLRYYVSNISFNEEECAKSKLGYSILINKLREKLNKG